MDGIVGKKNTNIRVIMDYDFIFDRELAGFIYLVDQGLLTEDLLDLAILARNTVDSNIFPFTFLSEELTELWTDLLDTRIIFSDERYAKVYTKILELLSEFIMSEDIYLTIAHNGENEKNYFKKFFSNQIENCVNDIKYIDLSDGKIIGMKDYDALYIKDYNDLAKYNFDKIERRTVYITESKANFNPEKIDVLRNEFLSIGLRNDVMVISIYDNKINEKEN